MLQGGSSSHRREGETTGGNYLTAPWQIPINNPIVWPTEYTHNNLSAFMPESCNQQIYKWQFQASYSPTVPVWEQDLGGGLPIHFVPWMISAPSECEDILHCILGLGDWKVYLPFLDTECCNSCRDKSQHLYPEHSALPIKSCTQYHNGLQKAQRKCTEGKPYVNLYSFYFIFLMGQQQQQGGRRHEPHQTRAFFNWLLV